MTHEVAYCGHHCKHCNYTECTGCRSQNANCSYANLFKDKTCPNVTCCNTKKISGCYECSELSSCNYGFYSRADEQVAKATALFIQKHGISHYDITLERAINSGIKYPEDFNCLESIEEMIELLEKYLHESTS